MRRTRAALALPCALAALCLTACGGDKPKANGDAPPPAAAQSTSKPKPLKPEGAAEQKAAVHGESAGGPANPHAAGGPANPHAGGGPTPARAVAMKAPEPSAPVEITPDGKTTDISVAGLSFKVPGQWERQPPANRMRIDQYDVPGPAGGASLGVFRFPGGGGGTQQNIDRWVNQFDQPDGKASKEVAKIESREAGGLTITTVNVSGTYQGAMGMRGGRSAEPQKDSQLLAAIVSGSGDPYFFKLQGPARTVGVWTEQWKALTDSFALVEGGGSPAKPEAAPKPEAK